MAMATIIVVTVACLAAMNLCSAQTAMVTCPLIPTAYHQCKGCGLIDVFEPKQNLAKPPRIDRHRLRSLKRFGSLKREMRSGIR